MWRSSFVRVAGVFTVAGCLSLMMGVTASQGKAAKKAGHQKAWVQVAAFSGETDQDTDTFTIPSGSSCYISWTTKMGTLGGRPSEGSVFMFLKDPADELVSDRFVFVEGVKSGKTNIYKHGTFFIRVRASEPWTINVFVKK